MACEAGDLLLAGAPGSFSGPSAARAAADGLRVEDGLSALLDGFCKEHLRSVSGLSDACSDKARRKQHWRKLGVPDGLLVPTLYSGALRLAGRQEVPEWEADESGGWAPCMTQGAPTYEPTDPACREAVRAHLRRHGALVLKPTRGANSRGVTLLVAATDPLLCSARTECAASRRVGHDGAQRELEGDGEPLACVLSAERPLISFHGGELDALERFVPRAPPEALPFEAAWRQTALRLGEAGLGDETRFLVERAVPHDIEVGVLVVNGGQLQVIAGRSACMDRLLLVEGRPPVVAPPDFGPVDARDAGLGWLQGGTRVATAEPAARAEAAARMLQQKAANDPLGRTLCEAVRGTAAAIALAGLEEADRNLADEEEGAEEEGAHPQRAARPLAAVRVDFLVRWERAGEADGGARLWLSEVEHGFNAGFLVHWYGQSTTTLLLRAWLRGGAATP